MRFPEILLVLAMPAAAATVTLPDPRYDISASYAIDNGAGAASQTGTTPGTYTAGCGLFPICASVTVSATPSPSIVAAATTDLIFTGHFAQAAANITYDYAVTCNLCAPGTLVPITLAGFVQFDYFFGIGSTLSGDSATVTLFGENSGGSATASAGEGFCISTSPPFNKTCSTPAAGTFLLPAQAKVNTVYPITISVGAGFEQFPSTSEPSFAAARVDPVISFAPGFDATGYSIEVSPGIGNAAATAPEPATFALFAVGGWLLWRRRGLIMEVSLHGRPQTPGTRNHSTHC